MNSLRKPLILLLLVTLLGALAGAGLAQDDITLTMLTHWGTEGQLAAQQTIIDGYMEANPGVNIELVTVDFGELRTKIITGRTAGISADVYHFYHLWLPDFVNAGVLAEPTQDGLSYMTKMSPKARSTPSAPLMARYGVIPPRSIPTCWSTTSACWPKPATTRRRQPGTSSRKSPKRSPRWTTPALSANWAWA